MIEATPIELRKIAYRQSAKDGLVITFAVHPNDMPQELAGAPIGTRFMGTLVEIGDDEQPVKKEQHPLVRRAGILCNDPEFQAFLRAQYLTVWEFAIQKECASPQEYAADVLRQALRISSRRELATNAVAGVAFENIMARFEEWKLVR